MFSKMFSRFTRKRTPTKSKTSTQKSSTRVVHVEEPVPTLPEALNTTHETIANLKEEKVRIKNNLSAQEKIVNEAQAELDNANDYNREQKRRKLNQVTQIKKMLTNNLHHINVQISKFETMVETMDSMAQHLKNVEDEALKSRAGKRKLRNKTKGGMFKMFRKNSTGTKKRGMFSMFSRTKTPSTRMSTNTLTPEEEADVDREIAKLEEEEKQINARANQIYKEIVSTLGDKFEFRSDPTPNKYGEYVIQIRKKGGEVNPNQRPNAPKPQAQQQQQQQQQQVSENLRLRNYFK